MMRIIDTHIHFWDLSTFKYPWLDGEEFASLRSNFAPRDVLVSSPDVIATVHIQAEMDHRADPVAETAWLADIRQEKTGGRSAPTVCVGYADISAADLPHTLDRHQEYEFFRGIRQEAWYDPTLGRADVPKIDLLSQPQWVEGLREIARRGLTFDLLVFAHQLRQAAEVFSRVPELCVVIDHLGLPGSASDTEAWKHDLEHFRSCVPNAFIKISGLAGVGSSLTSPAVRSAVLTAVDIFGPGRSMVGSNFPVDRERGNYEAIWHRLEQCTEDLTEMENEALYVGTAAKFYGIQPAVRERA